MAGGSGGGVTTLVACWTGLADIDGVVFGGEYEKEGLGREIVKVGALALAEFERGRVGVLCGV